MSLCTFVMIASSAMRIVIYIQYYYLTFLRILVLWGLTVLTLIFVGVIAYIVRESFPLFRYSLVVFTCFYIVLSFSHPDYWIAKVNLAGAEATRSDFFKGEAYEDYDFLSELNADAAPVLIEWLVDEGYNTNAYYVENMSQEKYMMENGGVVNAAGKNEINEKISCAYWYLQELRETCGDMSPREFNLSRFLADFEVLYQTTKGM